MHLLDGKTASTEIKKQLAKEVKKMVANDDRPPHLCAILVGKNGASETYVASKVKNCAEVGFKSSLIRLPETVREDDLLFKIREVNEDESIDGLIVQLPLPRHISVQRVTRTILPSKDVDGFSPINSGRLMQNYPCFIPATPFGILLLLEHFKIQTAGKHCVVLGRSNIVGLPMSVLMARNANPGNCTVTICHSKTRKLAEITRSADILIAALGRPNYVKAPMVKNGAVVIDVGITRVASKKSKSGFTIVGDVDFKNVSKKASWISPVPGGVGLMTIVGLLKNTLRAARNEVVYE
jgi:methylenetetrahydrofolate dehydrogenase (NADP+)/methenyltetrahydrofolate cyclohydrolase